MEEKKNAKEGQAPKKPEAPPEFRASGLRSLGAGVWVYRHEAAQSVNLPDLFWDTPKRAYGMKEGDCVIFIAGKNASLVVT